MLLLVTGMLCFQAPTHHLALHHRLVSDAKRGEPVCDAAWKPTRKPYKPSWMQGSGGVYREMQQEYSAYAAQQDSTRDAAPTADSNETDRQASANDAVSTWVREVELAVAPVHYLCVSDVTDGHPADGARDGRALSAGGRELKVLIVASRFGGMRQRERQQIVNAVLSEHIASGALHSVQMRCWAPEEWEEKGSPVNLGHPCSFSSAGKGVLLGEPLPLPGCTE